MATPTKPPSRSKLIASRMLAQPKGAIAALKAGAAPNLSKQTLTAMTGNGYRDLIASYIHENYAPHGLDVYLEISLGKTIIGKDRFIDIFVVRPEDRKAIAIECKYQDSQGTVDEKIPYALADLEALWMPGLLVYAGSGWSKGVMHSLEASRLAAYCLPDATTLGRSRETRELDHILASVFGFWDLVLPPSKKLRRAP
ncbi:MAG TPA: PD-(D/E)XK nuclease superfamily protein [Kofleriaceae bacterium]|nr:PD-(D/E)XK nuclease superfamily protein [Kofleriaceae bacterium]